MAGTTPSPESRCPVGRGPDGTWALRGHTEVEAAARDPRRFSSAASSHLNVPNGMDIDEHRRFRAVIDRHLADDVIRPLEPSIRHIAGAPPRSPAGSTRSSAGSSPTRNRTGARAPIPRPA